MTEASEKPHDDSPFWRFSLRFYARSSVASACLVLQDEAGVDVNLLLFLLFLAEHGRRVSEDQIAQIDEGVRAWRDQVVKPLRQLRRTLKPGIGEIPVTVSEGFRGQIKRLELESEHVEQTVLEAFHAADIGVPEQSRSDAAEANLAAYEARLGPFPAVARARVLSAFAEFGTHHPRAED